MQTPRDHQDRNVVRRGWPKGAARDPAALSDVELRPPSARPWRGPGRPPARHVPRHHDVGALEPAPRRGQSAKQARRRCKRGVGHDVERTAREAQVRGVGDDDRHGVTPEPATQLLCAVRMQLDGNDSCAASKQWGRNRATPSAHVEHEVVGSDAGESDEPRRPVVRELVEPPPRRMRGHGRPSRTSPSRQPTTLRLFEQDVRARRHPHDCEEAPPGWDSRHASRSSRTDSANDDVAHRVLARSSRSELSCAIA